MAWNQGGGQVTLAWVSWPPPSYLFLKACKYHMILKTVTIFHVIILNKLILLVWIKRYFSHIWLAIRVGVKIPRPGYLDPHPLICFLKLNKYHMLSKSVAIFQVFIVIKLIQLVWIKKFFSHVWLANRGGGQDTLAGVSWPPTHLFVSKSSTNTKCYQKLLQYFMLFL